MQVTPRVPCGPLREECSRQRERPVHRPRGSTSSGTEEASMAGRVREVEQVGEEAR